MGLKKNVGLLDQILRALIILDLLVPCLLGYIPAAVACLMLTAAAVLLVSCVTCHCWIYDNLAISTLEETSQSPFHNALLAHSAP